MALLTITTNGSGPSDSVDMGPAGNTVLLNKFPVDSMLLQNVQSNLEDILPSLVAGVEYSTEDLVGAELWADWTLLGQRQAHLCLKHLATLPGARLTAGCGTNGAVTFVLATR